MAIYKHCQGFKLGTTENKSGLSGTRTLDRRIANLTTRPRCLLTVAAVLTSICASYANAFNYAYSRDCLLVRTLACLVEGIIFFYLKHFFAPVLCLHR